MPIIRMPAKCTQLSLFIFLAIEQINKEAMQEEEAKKKEKSIHERKPLVTG